MTTMNSVLKYTVLSVILILNKKTKIATLEPKLDGTYKNELPAGNYIIDFDPPRTNRIGGSNLPVAVSIADLDTSFVNINIDTGIR